MGGVIARELSLPRQPAQHVVDPIEACVRRLRGRKRKLTEAEEHHVPSPLDNNPDSTNTELAAVVRHKWTPRTTSNVLVRRQPPFSRKRYIDHEPAEATEA